MIILAVNRKSFHGHPAKREANTLDAMSVITRKGKPHFPFNDNNDMHPIRSGNATAQNLLPDQTAYDRPDLRDRVFKIRLT